MKRKKRKVVSSTLPTGFLERLAMFVSPSVFREMEKLFVERPTTLRTNGIKVKKHESMKAILGEFGFKTRKVDWYKDAMILENRTKRDLTETKPYEEGKIYIQSLASMVPPLILDPKPGEKVLDLTAAPGSKTSQMAMMMEKTGELVANDNNKVRFFKLKHNMELLGVVGDADTPHHSGGQASPTSPLNGEGGLSSDWKFVLRMEHGAKLCREYPEYFDKILLDAPCSAEARFVLGNPKTFGYWSERKIKEMAYKQRQLLLAAWGALKPGGVLVYSTCTMAPEENEVQISRLLERNPDAEIENIAIPGLKVVPPVLTWKEKALHSGVKKSLRIMPTKEVEGFFVAKIRKRK